METVLAKQTRLSPLQVMAERFSIDEASLMTTLKATCFKIKERPPTNEEVYALAIVANEYGLNPFRKELYAFLGPNGCIVPIVPIDGWSRIVNENPAFDGCEFEEQFGEDGKLQATTCIMHVKGRSCPVRVTEYVCETYRNTNPWNQMPARMNRHKAFMQAARYAFTISGLHDEDEGYDILENEKRGRVAEVAMPRRKSEAAKVLPAPTQEVAEIPPADDQDYSASGADIQQAYDESQQAAPEVPTTQTEIMDSAFADAMKPGDKARIGGVIMFPPDEKMTTSKTPKPYFIFKLRREGGLAVGVRHWGNLSDYPGVVKGASVIFDCEASTYQNKTYLTATALEVAQ